MLYWSGEALNGVNCLQFVFAASLRSVIYLV